MHAHGLQKHKLGLAAGLTMLLLLAAACGGGGDGAEPADAQSTAATSQAADSGASEPSDEPSAAAASPDAAESASEAPSPSDEPASDESASDEPASGSEEVVGVTDDQITIGTPAFRTGPVATDGIHFAQGWETCFNRINDAGGINGRTLNVISDDTQFDATQALPIATKLVEQDGVFAIVASQDLTFHLATQQYLHDNGVPDIGVAGLVPPDPELDTNFAVGASVGVIGHIMGDYAYTSGMRRVAILGHEVGELGTAVLDSAADAFEARGGEVVFQQEFPLTSTDQPALVTRARSEDVDGILLNASSQMYLRFMAAANSSGYHPPGGWVLGPGAEDVIEDLAQQAPKAYGVTGGFNSIYQENPTEEMQLLLDAYEQYYPEERPWTFSYHGWVGCRLFEEAVTEVGDELTREAVVEYLNGLEEWDSGLGPTYTWNGNESRVVNQGAAVIGVENGEITQVQDWAPDPLAAEG